MESEPNRSFVDRLRKHGRLRLSVFERANIGDILSGLGDFEVPIQILRPDEHATFARFDRAHAGSNRTLRFGLVGSDFIGDQYREVGDEY